MDCARRRMRMSNALQYARSISNYITAVFLQWISTASEREHRIQSLKSINRLNKRTNDDGEEQRRTEEEEKKRICSWHTNKEHSCFPASLLRSHPTVVTLFHSEIMSICHMAVHSYLCSFADRRDPRAIRSQSIQPSLAPQQRQTDRLIFHSSSSDER